MKPDKLTLFELFEKQRRYVVPLFQRPYVWTEEDQWTPLWEDVRGKMADILDQTVTAPHFLGAIVIKQMPVFGKQVPAYEVIDGQQRLTTMQVLLTALKDFGRVRAASAMVRDLERVTVNDCVMQEEFEKFKVWPTNADRAAFVRTAIAGKPIPVVEPSKKSGKKGRVDGHKLEQAYRFFYGAVESAVADTELSALAGGDAAVLDTLFEALRRQFQFVVIELEGEDDPQVIFESLNARGAVLLPSDLIRNFVFMTAQRAGEDIDSLYQLYWREYDEKLATGKKSEEPFWKQTERQGRITRPRLDHFFFHFVQCRLEREVNVGHLFQEFRGWWAKANGKRPVAEALQEIQRFSSAFATWLEPSGDDSVQQLARTLKLLDTGTAYPALLEIVVGHELPPEAVDLVVRDIESYLVRRALCGLTPKNYNRFFVTLVREFRKNPAPETVQAFLSGAPGDSTRWPDDIEFGRAWLHRPAYGVLRQAVVNDILRRLNTAGPKTEGVALKGDLTIEHVMPQEWEAAWPDVSTDDERATRERLIHTFGNLTLLTHSLNSSVSNGPFLAKRDALEEHSILALNKYFRKVNGWDEQEIVRRGRLLFDQARTIWPHPKGIAAIDDAQLAATPEILVNLGADSGHREDRVTVDAARQLLDQFVACRASENPVARFTDLLNRFQELS